MQREAEGSQKTERGNIEEGRAERKKTKRLIEAQKPQGERVCRGAISKGCWENKKK